MKKYRIILKNGSEYMPQVKGWFFWHDILNSGLDSLEKSRRKEYMNISRVIFQIK